MEDNKGTDSNKESNWRDYRNRGIAVFVVAASCILFFFAIFKLDTISDYIKRIISILQPIIFGLIIAFILDPIVEFWEVKVVRLFRKLKDEKKAKSIARAISAFVAIIIMFMIIFALGYLVIPSFIASITAMIKEFPGYVDGFLVWVKEVSEGESDMAVMITEIIQNVTDYFEEWLKTDLLTQIENYIGYFTTSVFGIVNVFLNLVIGVVVSTYVLCSKNKFIGQGKKFIYSVFGPRRANVIMMTLRQSNRIFAGFISGKLIDSLIVGIICFLGMTLLNLPYVILVSVIIGVTNIIPFFGPYIGAIPSAVLILLVNPSQGIVFIIFIIILQQVDGNIIGPKILGSSTGLSAFWVVFAILLGGGLFGLAGMIIGVPTFAVIYYMVKSFLEYRLKKRNLPVDSEVYSGIASIDGENNELVFITPEEKTSHTKEVKEKINRIKDNKSKDKES